MNTGLIHMALAHHYEVQPVAHISELRVDLQFMAIPSELRDFEFSEKLDFFALLVDARSGISPQMIEVWQHYQDRQFPRVLLVQGIEFSESDFDDIVLIGNRVLEQFATPYLVLHDEIGEPTGLISLEDNIVHDYSGSTVTNYPAEKEMIELIKDFQDEYTQLYKELGTEGFFQGIFAIALPIGSSKRFGTPELNRIIESLTKH
ncbi:MAG: hypothetical protein ACO3T6_05245 [Candidatus Nanopelagicaceae bacterium]|jgi:hypothetical protein